MTKPTAEDIARAIEILQKNDVPPKKCVRCGAAFYLVAWHSKVSLEDILDIKLCTKCGGGPHVHNLN